MCEYCYKKDDGEIMGKTIRQFEWKETAGYEPPKDRNDFLEMFILKLKNDKKAGLMIDSGYGYRYIDINYCPMCRKEAGRVRVLKKGEYSKENIITCEKCGCKFQYYDTEIIVNTTTPDEESFLGGFGVHKYLKCPTCNAICTISTNFIEHKSIFTEIKELWKDLFYASTSKEGKQ